VSGALSATNSSTASDLQVATNLAANELSALRQQLYHSIISSGGLSAGSTQAANAQQAAIRLDGANELLNGYISLGVPQALASDDTLKGLVSGVNSDTFAPPIGGLAGTARDGNVPAQVVDLYQAAINDDQPNPIFPVTDPADLVAKLVDQRATQLAGALNAHIVASGAAQAAGSQGQVRLSAQIAAPQSTGTVFGEENPYLGPTLDRLAETAFVLNDQMNGTATSVGTPSAPGTTATAVPAPPATTTGAKCTLKALSNKVLLAARKGKAAKGAPKPGTLSLTMKCSQGGKVKLTGVLTQLIGAKPKHGKRKAKTYKLGPVSATVRAGRVTTLTVKLPRAAVTALAGGARESATFTVTRAGGGRATTKLATLRGIR
jgi:hypothetical protein